MIAGFFAGVLGTFLMIFSLVVIKARRKYKISYGVGENNEIAGVVYGHHNFVSYSVFFIILFFLTERNNVLLFFQSSRFFAIFLFTLGSLFTLGRWLHFRGLSRELETQNYTGRILGMHLTVWPIVILSILNVLVFLFWLFAEHYSIDS